MPVIPYQVLLVLDEVNALTEGAGNEACKSLADFVDQLCGTSPHLKLLVTSENSLSNCTEQVGARTLVYKIVPSTRGHNSVENVHKCADICKTLTAFVICCHHVIVFSS